MTNSRKETHKDDKGTFLVFYLLCDKVLSNKYLLKTRQFIQFTKAALSYRELRSFKSIFVSLLTLIWVGVILPPLLNSLNNSETVKYVILAFSSIQ